MKTLGIHGGHDASAALVEDGRVIADVAEERFLRIKHYSGLPLEAIRYCVAQAGGGEQIDCVAFAHDKVPPVLASLLAGKRDGGAPTVELAPLYLKPFELRSSVDWDFVGHHESHAACAYYTCGRPLSERVVVATVDGSGGTISTAMWRGQNGKLELLEKHGDNGSLGWFYGNVTELLGWWHGDGEGKTMGLAPYGDPSRARGVFDGTYPRFENGALVAPHEYGPNASMSIAGGTHYHFREATQYLPLLQRHSREDLAAEAQRVLEEEVMRLVLPWLEKEGTRSLACAGGVFLNVKLNQRIWYTGKVEHHWIYPNPADSGLAVGAALQAYHRRTPGAPLVETDTLYHGPGYTDEAIERALTLRNLPFTRPDDLVGVVAEALAKNEIVGWFQGRMESGPRALGNRSILMSANRAENKDTINARVKFREGFRPFCPSLLYERRDEYLRAARDERFMITSFDVTDAKRAAVPAVVHVDGTLRPQLVRKEDNALYHALLTRFAALTGEGLLLNTSFNVMGEPIVCTPSEAIRCFFDSGMDLLALGSFVLRKR